MTEILAAVIGAAVGSVLSALLTRRISYPQGVEQGKRLVLHEKSVEVLTEIRKRLHEVRNEWADWVSKLPNDDKKRDERLLNKTKALENYYEENKFVLSKDMQRKVERMIRDIEHRRSSFHLNLSVSKLADDEDKQRDDRYQAGLKVSNWLEHEFSEALEDLDSHLREIIGAT